MIKIIVEVKENDEINLKQMKAIDVKVSIDEIERNASISEKEVSKIIKNRINNGKSCEFLNKSKTKSNIEVIEELLKAFL